ncbi:hypothetical protein DFH27DRAFT_106054 [Peziza echinospora]|nr:hypothetical protein DFH27DRAFT_106054 [Peziza echinospora]
MRRGHTVFKIEDMGCFEFVLCLLFVDIGCRFLSPISRFFFFFISFVFSLILLVLYCAFADMS